MENSYTGVLITFLFAAAVTALMVTLTSVLGPKRRSPTKDIPYETGKDPFTLPSKARISIHFYLIAMIFIIFDVEIAFLFPWAVSFREFGWAGFLSIALFVFFILLGFWYAWKNNALDAA